MDLIKRFNALKTSAFGSPLKRKYLLPPDKKDSRWGIEHFDDCEPITEKQAEQIIRKMEQKQSGVMSAGK